MDLATATNLAKPIRPNGVALTLYDLGKDGLIRAEPGALAGCPHDIRVQFNLPGTTPRPPDHNSYFTDLDRRRLHPGFDRFMRAAEDVFAGGCPLVAAKQHLEGYEDAPRTTFSPTAWLCLLQLFVVEQELNYHASGRKTHWRPPSGFHMEYVRWVAAGTHSLSFILGRNNGRGWPAAFPKPFAGPGKVVDGPSNRYL